MTKKEYRHSVARTPGRRTGPCDKELAALLVPFQQLRVLCYAAKGAIQPATLLNTLRRQAYPMESPALHRLLRRLTREGWLKCSINWENGDRDRSEFILTARGRVEFHLARRRLMELQKVLACK